MDANFIIFWCILFDYHFCFKIVFCLLEKKFQPSWKKFPGSASRCRFVSLKVYEKHRLTKVWKIRISFRNMDGGCDLRRQTSGKHESDEWSIDSTLKMARRRIMEWAGRENHMGGIPRKIAIMAVGAFAKAVATFLNTTSVHNADTLINLVRSRPPGIPLITVSNHMSTSVPPGPFLIFLYLCIFHYSHYAFFHLSSIFFIFTGWMIQWCGDSKGSLPWRQTWLDGYLLLKIFVSRIHSYPTSSV